MNFGKLFAWAVIVLQVCASGGYLFMNDWKRAVLWLAVAVANTMITI